MFIFNKNTQAAYLKRLLVIKEYTMKAIQPDRQPVLLDKLFFEGARSLSDIELLAVFISPDSPTSSLSLALDLINRLGDLRAVLHSPSIRLGLGESPFAQLQTAKEMCRRSDLIDLHKEGPLHNSRQTYAFLKKRLRDYKNETFVALFLDNQHRLLAYEELFSGTINAATVHIRPIIERILHFNAAALILAHNHPSGDSTASPQDISVTHKLRQALELIDVRLLDHIVIGDNEIYSIMADHKWSCH